MADVETDLMHIYIWTYAGTNSDLAGALIQFQKSFKIKTAHVNARLEPSSNLHSGSTILKHKKCLEKKLDKIPILQIAPIESIREAWVNMPATDHQKTCPGKENTYYNTYVCFWVHNSQQLFPNTAQWAQHKATHPDKRVWLIATTYDKKGIPYQHIVPNENMTISEVIAPL